jgi:redox-sensitive bicupin YhaK (pirin superfamily)
MSALRQPEPSFRAVVRTVRGMPASDGAGVRLTRLIGQPALEALDPFLLLDEFKSDRPEDYVAGFPDHPHRGFETVTYMLAGRMRHSDSDGHSGVIEAGGVQWMTAGRGIVHSEMPEQEDGLLWGFQLWINLPAAQKMREPAYQEFGRDRIPEETREGGARVRVIAGVTAAGTAGPVAGITTAPRYLDVAVPAATVFEEAVPETANAFVYVYEGEAAVGESRLAAGSLGVLGPGDAVRLLGGERGGRLLLLAATPLDEPVARAGPFVMNTREELIQAFSDMQAGRLG